MKTIGNVIFLIFYSFSSSAQIPKAVESKKSQYYLGLRVNTIDYVLFFNKSPSYGDIGAAAILHLGFHLTDRSTIQIGLAYGGQSTTVNSEYYDEDGIYVTDLDHRRTRAVLLPLTWRYTINPTRRFQFFGSASFVTTYGVITSTKTPALRNGVTPTSYREKVNGLNAFVNGSLGLNCKISKRWEGFGESIFFHRNLKGSFRYGVFRSIGVGINYNLYWNKL